MATNDQVRSATVKGLPYGVAKNIAAASGVQVGTLTAANAAASPPTQTEFNKVIADLATLKTQYNALVTALTNMGILV